MLNFSFLYLLQYQFLIKYIFSFLQDVTQLTECSPHAHKALVQALALHKLVVMMYT